jgi:hypothetical protein
MVPTPTRRWPASLHGGQIAILMVVLSGIGYTGMSFAAVLLWNPEQRAVGTVAPVVVRWWFVGAVALVAIAHLLGHLWAKARTLNIVASLCLALWLPAVVALWSGRSFADVDQQRMAIYEVRKKDDPGNASWKEQNLSKIESEYAMLLLADGLVAVVMLFIWFGERRPKVLPPSTLPPTAETHDAL